MANLSLGKVVAIVLAVRVADVVQGGLEASSVALDESNAEVQGSLLGRLLTVGEALRNFRPAVENVNLIGLRSGPAEGKRGEKRENEQTGCNHCEVGNESVKKEGTTG